MDDSDYGNENPDLCIRVLRDLIARLEICERHATRDECLDRCRGVLRAVQEAENLLTSA